jgi:hypothetical protein
MEASGERSSWLTLATSSVLSRSSSFRRVMSAIETRYPSGSGATPRSTSRTLPPAKFSSASRGGGMAPETRAADSGPSGSSHKSIPSAASSRLPTSPSRGFPSNCDAAGFASLIRPTRSTVSIAVNDDRTTASVR